ncbi:MAG: hypothetical protein J6S29_02070 [Methanosphaera sp.]|nr:hypothetical protein [Methanosphaera sp.]
MSKSIMARISRCVLLFLGGIALGYSIKTLMDDGLLDKLMYKTRDMMYKPADKEYVDVEIED